MKLVIVTHVPHIPTGSSFSGYSAYVREMNSWSKFVDELIIVAPITNEPVTAIHQAYNHQKVHMVQIPQMAFVSWLRGLKTLLNLPFIIFRMVQAFYKADHIHLRCPGTIGLVGCFVQILFPSKPKTAKYAGNWDPIATQPLSYKLQKWILSNTFLTRNMKVLVYGKWQNQSKNIVPFFTASYRDNQIPTISEKVFSAPYKALFVGTLSAGKRPLYAIQLIEKLQNIGVDIHIDMYGDGEERDTLERYISTHNLDKFVSLNGNKDAFTIQHAYQTSDFLLLPSKSEGWPKVVAEAMFWGCIPLATHISCVPWMLDEGNRGVLLSLQLAEDAVMLKHLFDKKEVLMEMAKKAQSWSHQYTLDVFEKEIEKLIHPHI